MLCFNVVLLSFVVLFKPANAVTITNTDYSGIQTGTPFTVTWTDASGPVAVILKMGNSTNFNALEAIRMWTDNLGTSFTWTPWPALATGPYRYELADTAVEGVYSPLFTLTNIGGVPSSSTSSSAPSSTFTSTSSKSAATSAATTSATITPTATPTPATDPEPTPTPRSHLSRAIKAGICVALILLVLLTTYCSISLLRRRYKHKKHLQQNPTTAKNRKHQQKSSDVEMIGGAAEMSGALDSLSNAGVSSRDTSTRGTSSMAEIAEPEPVEIGSSGYGREMSAAEKATAVELEANQRIRFEERKKRRKGVRLWIGNLKIWL